MAATVLMGPTANDLFLCGAGGHDLKQQTAVVWTSALTFHEFGAECPSTLRVACLRTFKLGSRSLLYYSILALRASKVWNVSITFHS